MLFIVTLRRALNTISSNILIADEVQAGIESWLSGQAQGHAEGLKAGSAAKLKAMLRSRERSGGLWGTTGG